MGGNSSIERSQDTKGSTEQSTKSGFRSLRTNRSSEITQGREDHGDSKADNIHRLRIVLCISLALLACILGFFVFYLFSAAEENLAMVQFESIAQRATHYAQHATEMKRNGVITMATMIGVAHPSAEDWPFVLVDGYEAISSRLVETITGDGMGFAPIVTPDQLEDFEEFAYDSYYNTLGYPNGTGISSFGRGVWAKDSKGLIEEAGPDQKYHEGTVHPNGETLYNSTYQIYAPVLQHSDGANAKPLMLNLHNEKQRGLTIDSILDCATLRSSNKANGTVANAECGQLTDLLLLTQRKLPASLIMQPIHPNNDPDQVTGIISSPFVWQDAMDAAFGTEVSGVYCVLCSSTGITYTYHVQKGQVELVGEGDLHETAFDDQEINVVLTDKSTGLYSAGSFSFTLKLYPSEAFMADYKTKNPVLAAIIILLVMFFLTSTFCLYDWYVRGEFTFKNELLEAKRNFIRFVSHEVRTPLNAVCMGLMLMREELDKAMKDTKKQQQKTSNSKEQAVSHDGLSEWKGVTDEILENSQNAVDVLNDLLNYDKITSGSLKLELSLLEVSMLMDHAQKEFKLPAAKKNIDVVFEDVAAPPYRKNTMCIVGDDVRLIQVLRNLMSNALKFTPRDGQVKVTLNWVKELPDDPTKKTKSGKKRQSFMEQPDLERTFVLKKGEKVCFAPSGYFQLAVEDTGAGMSPEQMSNVFEQGTQFNVNELQCGQGSGLGLYIAKGIMDQHLGSLTVSSEGIGNGTKFTMSVPVYRDPSKNNDESCKDVESDHFTFKASKAKSQSQMQNLSNLRILVVDDSDTNRKFLTRILHNHGHTCDQARDGAIAVEMVSESMKTDSDSDEEEFDESKHYDAVLLDYEMPTMNGPTAAQKMRDLGSDTFIVGITGNLLPEDIEYFRAQGANEVLPKPFNISDLEEILMEYGVGANK